MSYVDMFKCARWLVVSALLSLLAHPPPRLHAPASVRPKITKSPPNATILPFACPPYLHAHLSRSQNCQPLI